MLKHKLFHPLFRLQSVPKFFKSASNILNSESVRTLTVFPLTEMFPATFLLIQLSFLSAVFKSHLFRKIFLDFFFSASEIYAVNFMPVTHRGTFPGGIVLLVALLVNSLWDSLKSGCISYQLVEQLFSSHLISLSCKFLIYEKKNNHFILGCHIK